MTYKNSSIIRSCDIGPNYKKITLSTPTIKEHKFRPGQFAHINNRSFAVAGSRQSEIDFVVRSDSFIFNEQLETIFFPGGNGFQYIESNNLFCLAAGTGIGAFTELVNYRNKLKLSTHVHFIGREVNKIDIIKVFPQLNSPEFECWDTTSWGRPNIETELISTFKEKHVLYAGPKSLLDEIRSHPKCPNVHLNH